MFKTLMHWIGGLLALVGVGFVVERLWTHAEQLELAAMGWGTWFVLSFIFFIYGSSNTLLALSWRELLSHFTLPVPRMWSIWAWGVSQIAKYVPGNIFHLAGRQALGVSAGYSHRPLAVSAIWELCILAVMALPFAVLLLPLVAGSVRPIGALVSFIFVAVISLLAAKVVFGQHVSRSMFFVLSYLVISALVFVSIVQLNSSALAFDKITLLSGAFVLAWLVGLVTPGAPAGIGVRELVLMFLLKDQLPQAELITGVVLGRLVTAAGDGLFFVATSIYGRRFFSVAAIK